jgi:eukaryotic-like serine/threonine-protein kinase
MAKQLTRLVTVLALLGALFALSAAGYPIPGCKVPNVAHKPLASAESAIINANCSIGKISTAQSSIAIGNVISTTPGAGSSHPGGASVALKVSLGNPKPPVPGKQCTVPNVVHQTLAVAAKAIAKGNCKVGKISTAKSKKVKDGRIISSNPKAGAKKGSGAKVNLTISKGNKTPKKKKK